MAQATSLVKQAEKILKITYLEAKIFKSPIIGTEHLLLSILKDEDNVATKSIHAFNIDYDVAKEEFESLLSEGGAPAPNEPSHGRRRRTCGHVRNHGSGGQRRLVRTQGDPNPNPVLDNFGATSRMAEEGRLDPIVGRAKRLSASARF